MSARFQHTRYASIRQSDRADGESRRLAGVPGKVVVAARSLFEERGVHKTTVKDIAVEAGITRELVYYYFANKQGIIDAVLDDYVEDIVESVLLWHELRDGGHTPESLRTCAAAFRRALYDASGTPRAMIAVLEELGVRDEFGVRAVRETADFLVGRAEVDSVGNGGAVPRLAYEMVCVVVFGLVGLMKVCPEATDDDLACIMERALPWI